MSKKRRKSTVSGERKDGLDKSQSKSPTAPAQNSTTAVVAAPTCSRCGATQADDALRCWRCKSFVPGTKAARRHGVDEFERRGVLPPELRPDIVAFTAQLLTDQGGQSECSALQLGLVRRLTEVEAICRLLALDLAQHGVLSPRGRMRGSTSAYLAAVDRFNKLAAQLGLSRKQKPVDDLDDYLKTKGVQP